MYKTYSILLLIFICYTVSNGQASIDIPIIITDNGSGSKVLNFGLDINATNGIDPQLGESDLPPFPPAGVSEIRFNLTPYNNEPLSSYQDYRNAPSYPFSGNIQHRLWWQLSSGATTITINYTLPSFAAMQIQDLSGGSLVNSSVLTGSGSFTVTQAAIINQVNLNITYTNASGTTGFEGNASVTPSEYNLFQNYPNPFNPDSKIKYGIPVISNVRLVIYNVLGEIIDEIVNQIQEAGFYDIKWSALNQPSGIYFYSLDAKSLDGQSSYFSTRKMLLIK